MTDSLALAQVPGAFDHATGATPIRVLVISSVYPSDAQPTLGVFVHERMRHVAAHCGLVVVAPVPWFPFNRLFRGKRPTATDAVEHRDHITILHPRFLSVPRFCKSADGILYFLSILPAVLRLKRHFQFDLIDAHFAYPDGFAAALLARLLRRALIITIRGDEVRLARYPLRRLQMRFALKTGRVISVSDSLRQVAGKLGIPPETARVVPNAVDSDRFRLSDRGLARQQLGLPLDRTVLLSVGSLIERKGHHRILEILPELIRRKPDLLYVIVGDPRRGDTHAKLLETLVRAGALGDHVRFVRSQPHDAIPKWMAAADLFCLATRWEGWCNALMEALACGLPVVTTAVGGNPEFVRDRLDGLLVPYWDGAHFAAAVLAALDRKWDRAAISEQARGRSWEHVAKCVLEEFHAALAEHRRNVRPVKRGVLAE